MVYLYERKGFIYLKLKIKEPENERFHNDSDVFLIWSENK